MRGTLAGRKVPDGWVSFSLLGVGRPRGGRKACNQAFFFLRVHELRAAGGADVLRRWVTQDGGGGHGCAEGWVGVVWASDQLSLQCLPLSSAFLHPRETTITSTTWTRVKDFVTSSMCLFSTSDWQGHALCGWDRLMGLPSSHPTQLQSHGLPLVLQLGLLTYTTRWGPRLQPLPSWS